MAERSEKHSSFYNLMDAFKEKHCPFCYLSRKAVTGFLSGLLYENVNDPGIRNALKKAGGFCEKHSWQMVSLGDALGNAIIVHDLLTDIRDNGVTGKMQSRRKCSGECPACRAWNDAELRYMRVFVEYFEDPELQAGFRKSFGLCRGHFDGMMKRLKAEQRPRLVTVEQQKLDALVEELSRFQEKFNYTAAERTFGEDRDVWIRAVEFLKGRSDRFSEHMPPTD